jgi:hypothetical protein
MPRLHDSVTYCERCDHYVAALEVTACAECDKPVCPDCGHPCTDQDLQVCSRACAAKFRTRTAQQGEAA